MLSMNITQQLSSLTQPCISNDEEVMNSNFLAPLKKKKLNNEWHLLFFQVKILVLIFVLLTKMSQFENTSIFPRKGQQKQKSKKGLNNIFLLEPTINQSTHFFSSSGGRRGGGAGRPPSMQLLHLCSTQPSMSFSPSLRECFPPQRRAKIPATTPKKAITASTTATSWWTDEWRFGQRLHLTVELDLICCCSKSESSLLSWAFTVSSSYKRGCKVVCLRKKA